MYDIAILDAYAGRRVPEHLLKREFFAEVVPKLREGGILSLNIVLATMSPHLDLIFSILSTFHFSIFFVVLKGGHNMIIYCFNGTISRDEFIGRLKAGVKLTKGSREEIAGMVSHTEGALVEKRVGEDLDLGKL